MRCEEENVLEVLEPFEPGDLVETGLSGILIVSHG